MIDCDWWVLICFFCKKDWCLCRYDWLDEKIDDED